MAKFSRLAAFAALVAFSASLMIVGTTNELRAQAANPCAPKAGSASPSKPELDRTLISRPKGTKLFQGDLEQLVKQGEALFKSTKLSTNGLSCQSCHANNENFAASFSKTYPHEVAMVGEKAGIAKVDLDEMIQFCMVAPMQAKPLRWDSRELAALTAYNTGLQKVFRAELTKSDAKGGDSRALKAANPCAPAAKKAANPCSAANPCAPKK